MMSDWIGVDINIKSQTDRIKTNWIDKIVHLLLENTEFTSVKTK